MISMSPCVRPGHWFMALLLLGALSPLYAEANTITVDTVNDDTASNGNCTLREATMAANTDTAVDGCSAGSGADEIQLPAGIYNLTLAGTVEDASADGDLNLV